MTTGLISHPACLDHLPPSGHPESPDRLRAVLARLESREFQDLVRFDAPRAELLSLLRVHDRALVDLILQRHAAQAAREGYSIIDADTVMSAGSAEAALRAAGAAIAAVDGVHAGRLRNAFCAIRPPGHHAERSRAMGFCLFNNVAIGALHAREIHGFKRIAVIDFDVHHGNGTQDIFFDRPDLFYASTHQSPFYPGTGRRSERGIADNILNVPLPEGAGSAEFRAVFADLVLPSVDRFAPEFVFISAGFDAHRDDPLAGLRLDEANFGWATKEICALAAVHAHGRVVSVLEGGYDLDALARSAAAHVRALMEA